MFVTLTVALYRNKCNREGHSVTVKKVTVTLTCVCDLFSDAVSSVEADVVRKVTVTLTCDCDLDPLFSDEACRSRSNQEEGHSDLDLCSCFQMQYLV